MRDRRKNHTSRVRQKYHNPRAKETLEQKRARIAAQMSRVHKTQRYHVRVRVNGSTYIVCPCCGHIGWHKFGRGNFRIQCSICKTQYLVQWNLLMMPAGGKITVPPDFIIPDEKGEFYLMEAFPTGDMGYWRQGQCVHGMSNWEEWYRTRQERKVKGKANV